MSNNSEMPAADRTLGELLKAAREAKGLSFAALVEVTGLSQGQLHKLEKDQVKTINPAHLAVLAEPLGLSLYELYAAAGYQTPSAIAYLSGDLEDKLRQLPPDALQRLEEFIDRLTQDRSQDEPQSAL